MNEAVKKVLDEPMSADLESQARWWLEQVGRHVGVGIDPRYDDTTIEALLAMFRAGARTVAMSVGPIIYQQTNPEATVVSRERREEERK